MKTLSKWLLRILYFIVVVVVIGGALGFGLTIYDKIKIEKKAEVIKESIKQQLFFPEFLEKHSDFTQVSLNRENGPSGLCLSATQWKEGYFFLNRNEHVDFSAVVESFRQKIDSSDCRLIQILYFNNADAKGLWRASFFIVIDDIGRIERLDNINIYR